MGKSCRINETSLDEKVVEESSPFQPVGSNLDGYGGDRGRGWWWLWWEETGKGGQNGTGRL